MKITVVIPTFNSMKYIDQSLSSVLAQTYENMEVIVYDNESTDGTYEYLEQLNDGGFELRSIPNIYANSFLEAVLDVMGKSTSDYVTFISSDDYIHEGYVAENVKLIEDHPKEGINLQSGLIWVDEKGKPQNQRVHTYTSLEEFKEQCLHHCPVNSPTVFYHKSIWPLIMEVREAHSKYSLPEIGVGDYDMWCGFADRGIPILPFPGCLGYYYRWNPDQATWKVKDHPVNYDNLIQNYWKEKWSSNE